MEKTAETMKERIAAVVDEFIREYSDYRDQRNLTTQWNAHSDVKGFAPEVRKEGAAELTKRGYIVQPRVNVVLASVPTYGDKVAVDGQLIPREAVEQQMPEQEATSLFEDEIPG